MKDTYCVLSDQDGSGWWQALQKIPGSDIHFGRRYYQIFNEEGAARLFIYTRDATTILYPFILREVPGVPKDQGIFFDITSPYGYGGPLCPPGTHPGVVRDFYRSFQHYCRENNIVSEFIRFHPLLQNHRVMEDLMPVERNSTVFYLDLDRSLDDIWNGYQYSNRKNIKKAVREGVSVVMDGSPRYFPEFVNIYRQTMARNKAGSFYDFKPSFFAKIHTLLRHHYVYAHAWQDGQIISTELLIYNDTYIHSFLGGTLAEHFPVRPNNLLKHEVIRWAKGRKIRYFLLGGGRHDGDGIHRYKKTFSNAAAGFYIGKKVHLEGVFQQLAGQLSPAEQGDGFFPPYRR